MLQSKRLVSLDVMRGLTMACMILVNNPGSWEYVYAPLRHAEWHGWTPTDLVFPFFLFMVGAAIKLSLDKYLKTNKTLKPAMVRIVRRTLILIALGLFLNGFPEFDLGTWRIPGVLQRIALCYFFGSFLYLAFTRRWGDGVRTSIPGLALVFIALLAVYFVLMKVVPVPGYGAGLLGSPDGNLAGYIDRMVFGPHVWQAAKTWDPEGLLSTLPAIATTISGILAAWWIRTGRSHVRIFVGMVATGLVMVVIAYLLNPVFPINKQIWSPSYVFLSSGLAAVVLALIYAYMDWAGKRFGSKPFLIFGSNAITAYVLSSFFGQVLYLIPVGDTSLKSYLYTNAFQPVFGNELGSLMFALAFVLVWLGVLSTLYARKIFIKV